MRSLAGRLIAVVLATSLVVVLATALLTQRITADELEDAFVQDQQQQDFVTDQLDAYLFLRGDWDGVQGLIDELAEILDERVVLTDTDLNIISDSDPTNPPLPDREAAFIDPTNPAEAFELPIDGVIFGDFDEDLYEACLDAFGIPFVLISDLGPQLLDEATEEELALAEECADQALVEEFQVAEPVGDERLQALVFIGDEGDTVLSGLDLGVDPMLWWVILGAFAVAAAITWFAVRRELEPVNQLVGAADRIGSGDLSARVDPTGSEELSRLSSSFNEMASSIETEDLRRREFTSDVAHELRTPLSNMRGYLESAQDGVSPLNGDLIDSLHEDALHMQAIVDDLQVLTLAEAGTLQVLLEQVSLGSLLSSVVTAHKLSADAKGVSLVAEETTDVVPADPARLRQVLSNLLSNAVRHTPAGGSVTLGTSSDGNQTVISVTDTGEGIGEEHLPRLFERFYRADSSRTKATGGSGLGLAIAKQLVEAHDGKLTVSSVVGEGTTFEVALPA